MEAFDNARKLVTPEILESFDALLQSTALPVGYLTDERIESVYNSAANQHLRPQDKAIVYKFARALLAAARPQPVLEPLTADMFWNHDDAEQLYSSIEEFLNDEICNGTPLEVGHTRTIQRAVRLSNLEIRVTSIDEESCDAEYEVVQAANGITQEGKV